MAAADRLVTPAGIRAPHEILGIPAHELNPARIQSAAAQRLRILESAGGSETAVREAVTALIREARVAMLGAAAAALN